ncbi:MAG: TolC family protein [Rhodospirillales bacterium]|nr:TolC family protein [Rhodospirillales bacterium]
MKRRGVALHLSGFRGLAMSVLAMIVLAGCTVAPNYFTKQEKLQLAAKTLAAVQAQPLPQGPIPLHEAMARALIYNFDSRLDALEEDIARERLDASFWNFLPQSIASGGGMHRRNTLATNSESVSTGSESLEKSTSTEQTKRQADLRFTWNILDFGVSYFTARQSADQVLMAEERHKRVTRELMQEVRGAYWRAAASQRLLSKVRAMLVRVGDAIDKANKIQTDRLQKPMETLNYKRGLYSKLLQLQELRKTLLTSKLELARLMNLPPSYNYKVVVPAKTQAPPADLGMSVEDLEILALRLRPELIEAGYNERIAAAEVKKAMLRMLPGLEFSFGTNYDSNKFLLNNTWNEFGLKITWNLINFLKGRDDIEIAEKQEAVSTLRRQTLGMAIMAQLNIAYLDYMESVASYDIASELTLINLEIEKNQRGQVGPVNLGDLELIQTELNSLVSRIKRDEQYAQVQNALGRLIFSAGVDIYGEPPDTLNTEKLSAFLRKRETEWLNEGLFKSHVQAKSTIEAPAEKIAEEPDLFGLIAALFRDRNIEQTSMTVP